jgi:hypothetical protein
MDVNYTLSIYLYSQTDTMRLSESGARQMLEKTTSAKIEDVLIEPILENSVV